MVDDLEAQREYVSCLRADIGFSARPDMWLYSIGNDVYVAREPVSRRIILEISGQDLGIYWMKELERRARNV